ncbi:hypothetical protein K8R20_01570 [bacterium]|nr:hypothetical protein [bacterium]
MKKLIIVLVVLTVIAGGAYAGLKATGMLGSADEGNIVSDTISNIQEKLDILPTTEEVIVSSLQDLMDSGDTLKCTYVQDEEDVQAHGTIYIAGNLVHTEIHIEGEDGAPDAQMDMVALTEWVYVWTDAQPRGMKALLSAFEGGDEFDASEDVFGLEEELDLVCVPWVKDDAEFELPEGMEFDDITEMMEGFQGYSVEELKEMGEQDAEANRELLCGFCLTAPTQEEIDQCLVDAECDKL